MEGEKEGKTSESLSYSHDYNFETTKKKDYPNQLLLQQSQ